MLSGKRAEGPHQVRIAHHEVAGEKLRNSPYLSGITTVAFCYVLLIIAATFLTPAHAETTADRWNLSEIYPSLAAWNADADKVDAQLKDLASCKGHLGESAVRLKQCLDLQADLTKRYYRLETYAGEQTAEDTGNPAYLELDTESRPSRQPRRRSESVRRPRDPAHRQGAQCGVSPRRTVTFDLPVSAR